MRSTRLQLVLLAGLGGVALLLLPRTVRIVLAWRAPVQNSVSLESQPTDDTTPGERIVMDLAVTPPTLSLDAPMGRPLRVRVTNLAPATAYRITVLDRHSPTGRRRTRDPYGAHLVPSPAPPPCDQIARELTALLATKDEAAVESHASQLRATGLEGSCRDLLLRSKSVLESIRVWESALLLLGHTFTVKVERLSPVNREPERSWTLNLVGAAEKLTWPAASEAAWVVEGVARDIVEMSLYAKDRTPPGGPVAVELRGASLSVSGPLVLERAFAPQPYVWAPRAFEGLARGALASAGVSTPGTPSAGDAGIEARLLDAALPTLEQESTRVASMLAKDMRDATAHEEAALVIGALSLREGRGPYADVRALMSRMSAHLAMAVALRPDHRLSSSGQLAEAKLLVQSGRGADALKALQALSSSDASRASWIVALRLRATADYRLARRWSAASAVERLEHFRAVVTSLGAGEALALLDGVEVEATADWGRLALSEGNVEVANRFGPSAVSAELFEARRVLGVAGEAPQEIVAALNAPPERCVSVQGGQPRVHVIGRGQWAAFFGRQVLAAADASFAAAVLWLSLPEAAGRLEPSFDRSLAGLSLFPFLKLRMADMRWQADKKRQGEADSASRAACSALQSMVTATPQFVPYALWQEHDNSCRTGPNVGRPEAAKWFGEALLAGTAHDASTRLKGALFQQYLQRDPRELRALRDLAPFDQRIRHLYARATTRDPAPANKWFEAHAPLSDYSLPALRVIGSWVEGEDPAQKILVLRRLCSLEQGSCLDLGEALAKGGREDEAAQVLRRAFAVARNRVAASHHAEWLAEYEFSHGRAEEGLAIAAAAAETYSGAGLATYARLLERVGRLDESLSILEAYVARYDDAVPLELFAVRSFYGRNDERHRKQAEAVLARDFPEGLQRVAFAELESPPFQGVLINEETDLSRRSGIHTGDIVVALDGYRVVTHEQYTTVRALRVDPRIDLMVWRKGRYLEIGAELPGRSFQSRFTTWDGRKPGPGRPS